MSTFTYIGEIFQQGDSDKEIISFCAQADDIKKWGGVPTKTERFHGGFQRALTDRYKKIIEFFQDNQISPTSIVIAFREGTLKVDPLGYPSAWPSEEKINYLPKFAQISFDVEEYDLEKEDIETLCKKVCDLLKNRVVTDSETETDDLESEEETEEEIEEETEEETEEKEVSGDSGENSIDTESIDVGHSKLKAFYNFISNMDLVNSWLNDKQKEYKRIESKSIKNKKDKEYIEYTPDQRLRLLLISLLKPGMIVDGQHRVEGASAASTDNPIVFNICAIRDSDWVEQVFQFVVINKLAKPISGSFLTSILNTSLTNSEIAIIEPRLEEIGIKNVDRIIMNYINFGPNSPFKDMIAQPGEMLGVVNVGKLSDKGMLKIAKTWRSISNNKNKFKMFLDCMDGATNAQKINKWTNSGWVDFFYVFWQTIKELYNAEQLWVNQQGFHLLMIVTMGVLQDYFLEAKATAKIKFKDINDFKNQVKEFYEGVPAGLFLNWKRTGLQSGDGPGIIRSAIVESMNGKKLSTIKENHLLFKDI